MPQPSPFYAIQPAFTGGEISGEVASRVDLEKYQLALLQAENAIIRPYGPVYKRPGTIYCGQMKYADKEVVLQRFEYRVDLTYLLEIGDLYIRIWKNGSLLTLSKYRGPIHKPLEYTDIPSPFTEADLKNLRFVQSVDVMYICSGTYPVQKLSRYSERDWRLSGVEWIRPAYGDVNLDEEATIKPSGQTGEITITAAKNIFMTDRAGDTMKIEQYVNTETVSAELTTTAKFTSPNIEAPKGEKEALAFTVKKTGAGACKVTFQGYRNYYRSGENSDWDKDEWWEYGQKSGAGDWTLTGRIPEDILGDPSYRHLGIVRVTAEEISGEVSLTVTVGTKTYVYEVNKDMSYSPAIHVGKTWKIISHGTWTGQVVLQQSKNGGDTWVNLRTYTSRDDYNPTESGDVDEYSLLRIRAKIDSGKCTADLSAYPYRHEGYVRIRRVTDGKTATAEVIKPLGGLEKTAEWYWSAWSKTNGYPRCAAFFQDRLCFGACKKYPQRLWMSRTGDYENFGIEKEGGTVTDDSAVSADLLSRQAYTIHHMDVGNDLVLFTEGNTWTIAGGETVKPTSITPKNQENYGAGGVAPLRIGNRIVYVQRRGSIIRDTGYSYETDGYVGIDLTLLAKHLVRGHEIVSVTYAQEPDSLLYFVRGDGALLCLTYVMDQKVYAWSRFTTRGKYKAVCAVSAGRSDRVYVIVEREVKGKTVRCLEYFAPGSESDAQQDYVMMDAAAVVERAAPSENLPYMDVLDGKEIAVLADGYLYEGIVMRQGARLPVKAKRVTAGLPYTMTLEQPNWDAGNTDTGTVQGRKKTVTNAILRLTKSYGGRIGQTQSAQDAIIYDAQRMEDGGDVLYTGDKKVVLPAGGWNTEGRTVITHETPYPFNLSAIVREVSFGG